MSFVEQNTRSSFIQLKTRYPEYIPAIIIGDKDIDPLIVKKKYLMPKDINFGIVMTNIRKNIKLKSADALIFMIDNKIITPNIMVRELEKNDFVYINICKESVFGL